MFPCTFAEKVQNNIKLATILQSVHAKHTLTPKKHALEEICLPLLFGAD